MSPWRPFLLHHLERAGKISGIANCHAEGVHSLMLHDEPENRIRLFCTTPGHDLEHAEKTIGFHAHRTDIRLVPIAGVLRNIEPRLIRTGLGVNNILHECRYSSAVLGEQPRLVSTGAKFRYFYDEDMVLGPQGVWLPARQLHTVAAMSAATAWLVFEGKAAKKYDDRCYTPNLNWNTTGLYRPMKNYEVRAILQRAIDASER